MSRGAKVRIAVVAVLAAAAGVLLRVAPAREQEGGAMTPRRLTPEEELVIVHKATERPFTGKYWNLHEDGTYRCRRCGAPLFPSSAKFESGTGWPSFDDALPGAVREVPDPDGERVEIVCAKCGAHLGHVFRGEGLTGKGVRHCVNSASLDFEPAGSPAAASRTDEAFFAGGCFWGVEYWFDKAPGVVLAESGYMGGSVEDPTYEQVSGHRTGHKETVRVVFDPARTSYEALARLFFEIHDPTQADGQGPDVGDQYLSVVFHKDDRQRVVADRLIGELRLRGYRVATQVVAAGRFWRAEEYHQDLLVRHHPEGQCHARVKRFGGE